MTIIQVNLSRFPLSLSSYIFAFRALTLLSCCNVDTVVWASGRASGLEKMGWWGAHLVITLEWSANDLHMVQLMPLPPHHLLPH